MKYVSRGICPAILGIAAILVGFPSPVFAQRDRIAPQVDRLILRGPGSYIGVRVRDVEPSDGDRQRNQGGAVVEEVLRESPAEAAGIKSGDVIVEFDGERVRSARQLTRLVDETPPGRPVKATVLREGRRTEVTVTPSRSRQGPWVDRETLRRSLEDLNARLRIDRDQLQRSMEDLRRWREEFGKSFDFNWNIDGSAARRWLGVTVQELPSQLAEYFGAKEGVLVSSVADDSPASRAGLKAGDVITKVGTTTVRSRGDLLRALRDTRDDGEVTIGIVRDRQETTVMAKPEVGPRPRRTPTARQARGASSDVQTNRFSGERLAYATSV
jgi:serine protease Do